MRSLSTGLNTFGVCMAVLAVVGLAAESDSGFLGFGSVAVGAFIIAALPSVRGAGAPVPVGEARADGATRECGYCTSSIPAGALRCPQCSGEFHHCPRCNELVAVSTKQKFVGLARGGRAAVGHCLRCGKQLVGPRW